MNRVNITKIFHYSCYYNFIRGKRAQHTKDGQQKNNSLVLFYFPVLRGMQPTCMIHKNISECKYILARRSCSEFLHFPCHHSNCIHRDQKHSRQNIAKETFTLGMARSLIEQVEKNKKEPDKHTLRMKKANEIEREHKHFVSPCFVEIASFFSLHQSAFTWQQILYHEYWINVNVLIQANTQSNNNNQQNEGIHTTEMKKETNTRRKPIKCEPL